MPATSPDRLRAVITPVVESAGLDLEDLAVTSAGRRRLLRVAVERDGGVSLDDVALVSQRISDALDTSDAMGGQPYVLEVGSPGVDRPLTEPRHWRRARGRLVAGTLRDGGAFEGRVRGSDADTAVLDTPAGGRTLTLSDVAVARVQVEFAGADGADGAEGAEGADDADDADDAEHHDGAGED